MAPKVTYPDGNIPRICIVGAGFAGICAGVQLKRQLGITQFTILEKNQDVGGVWFTNVYPGAASDVPPHLYSYSFEPNPCWSKTFCPQSETWSYIKKVANKYQLYSNLRFNTSVTSMVWDQENKYWNVTTITITTNNDGVNQEEEKVEEFDIVILGTGPIRQPNIPPEFSSFTGQMFHSAQWDRNVRLENKIVGLVGNGASAIQIIPAIAPPKTSELIVYQRSPQYVFPRPQLGVPGFIKFLFYVFPCLLWALRVSLYWFGELVFGAYRLSNNIRHAMAKKVCIWHINWHIKDPKLRASLTPKYNFGYKLVLFSEKFYKTFNKPNVSLNAEPITKVEGKTITTTDGHCKKLDILILCTGFKFQDFFAPMHIIGINNIDLLQLWKQHRPRTFYGVTCHEAPNCFYLIGPNSVVGFNSLVFTIECQVTFIIQALRKLLKQNMACLQVKLSAQDESMSEIISGMKETVWGRDEGYSWHRNEHGINTTMWPYSCTTYWRKTRRIDCTKFHFCSRRDGAGGSGRGVEMLSMTPPDDDRLIV